MYKGIVVGSIKTIYGRTVYNGPVDELVHYVGFILKFREPEAEEAGRCRSKPENEFRSLETVVTGQ